LTLKKGKNIILFLANNCENEFYFVWKKWENLASKIVFGEAGVKIWE